MNRKYLDDIGADKNFYSLETQDPNEDRTKRFVQQRETYGFDDRETWALDCSFVMWLYERLSMYNEIATQVIDTERHIIKIGKEKITQQQSTDEMLKICKQLLVYQGNIMEYKDGKSFKRLMLLFNKTLPYLWW